MTLVTKRDITKINDVGTESDAVANVDMLHVIGTTIADRHAVANCEIIPATTFIDHHGVTVMDSKASAYGRGGLIS